MNTNQKSQLTFWGGVSGIIGTVSYIAAISISMNGQLLFFLTMLWPVLSVIFAYALYQYVSWDNQSPANQLSFVFACLGFTMVACMMAIQLAVGIGVSDQITESPLKEEELNLIGHSLRWVDQGLDVAWDCFIGVSIIFLSFAIRHHKKFGLGWTIPAALLGILIIVLNVITFPYPPNTKGLFDIGPAVGLFIIILSSRMIWLSREMSRV